MPELNQMWRIEAAAPGVCRRYQQEATLSQKVNTESSRRHHGWVEITVADVPA